MKKYCRKEEKKIAKQIRDLGVEDHETQLHLLGYNPEDLRKERLVIFPLTLCIHITTLSLMSSYKSFAFYDPVCEN